MTVIPTGSNTIIAWSAGNGIFIFKVLDLVFGLRVSERDELEGMDASEHSAVAYNKPEATKEEQEEAGLIQHAEKKVEKVEEEVVTV